MKRNKFAYYFFCVCVCGWVGVCVFGRRKDRYYLSIRGIEIESFLSIRGSKVFPVSTPKASVLIPSLQLLPHMHACGDAGRTLMIFAPFRPRATVFFSCLRLSFLSLHYPRTCCLSSISPSPSCYKFFLRPCAVLFHLLLQFTSTLSSSRQERGG